MWLLVLGLLILLLILLLFLFLFLRLLIVGRQVCHALSWVEALVGVALLAKEGVLEASKEGILEAGTSRRWFLSHGLAEALRFSRLLLALSLLLLGSLASCVRRLGVLASSRWIAHGN